MVSLYHRPRPRKQLHQLPPPRKQLHRPPPRKQSHRPLHWKLYHQPLLRSSLKSQSPNLKLHNLLPDLRMAVAHLRQLSMLKFHPLQMSHKNCNNLSPLRIDHNERHRTSNLLHSHLKSAQKKPRKFWTKNHIILQLHPHNFQRENTYKQIDLEKVSKLGGLLTMLKVKAKNMSLSHKLLLNNSLPQHFLLLF